MNSLFEEKKRISLLLVGQWYAVDNDGVSLIFDFTDNFKGQIPLTTIIKDKPPYKNCYELFTYPKVDGNTQYQFHVRIGLVDKKDFFIKKLTEDELILQPMDGYDILESEEKYIRKADTSIADDILKGLD